MPVGTVHGETVWFAATLGAGDGDSGGTGLTAGEAGGPGEEGVVTTAGPVVPPVDGPVVPPAGMVAPPVVPIMPPAAVPLDMPPFVPPVVSPPPYWARAGPRAAATRRSPARRTALDADITPEDVAASGREAVKLAQGGAGCEKQAECGKQLAPELGLERADEAAGGQRLAAARACADPRPSLLPPPTSQPCACFRPA